MDSDPLPLKRIGLWLFLICLGLIFAYLIFIAVISIITGLGNLNEDGSWVPITSGILIILCCLVFFLLLLRSIINQSKEKDIINI
jgi:hypothetical protein